MKTCLVWLLLSLIALQPLHAVISPSDPSSVQSGITAAYAAGQSSVTVPAGTYNLPPIAGSVYHLYFNHMSNFTINAQGAVFVSTDGTKRAIAFESCTNVTMNGGTFLRPTIPSSQGVIQAIAADYTSVDIAICAGYPTDILNTSYFDIIPVINVFDATHRQLKPGLPDIHIARVSGGSGPWIESLGGSLFRFHFLSPITTLPVSVGDYAAWRGISVPDFGVRACQGMVINGVTMKGTLGICFSELCGGGNQYNGCVITYPATPSGATIPPLLSSNADGFHSAGARTGPTVTDCFFEGLDDDGITVHGAFGLVTGMPAANQVYIDGPGIFGTIPFAAVGDTLNFYDTAGSRQASATITAIAAATGYSPGYTIPTWFSNRPPVYYLVTLNTSVPAGTNWEVSNTNMIGAGFSVSGCVVRDQRAHGMLIQSSNGTIQDCVVSNTVGGGIVVGPELDGFGQSDFANNLSILNNTISGVGLGREPWTGALTVAAWYANHFVPLPAGHRNVVISGNLFERNDGVNVLLSSSDNVQLTDNDFLNPMQAASYNGANFGVDLGALVWITQSTNAALSGNNVGNAGSYMTKTVGTTSTASGSGFTTGVLAVPDAAASFSGGTAAVVDAFPGIAGGYWLDTWKTAGASASTSGAVSSASPLRPWGGNYLAGTVTTTAAAGGGAIYRQFNGSTTGVNVTQPHQFYFDVRLDTIPTGSRYVLFNRVGGGTAGTDGNDTWVIAGSASGWQFLNGNTAGGGTNVAWTLGNLVVGTVYRFVVDVDPATKSWVVTVDNGKETYTSPTLGFRMNSASDGTYLHFGVQNIGTTPAVTFNYSVDNISILP